MVFSVVLNSISSDFVLCGFNWFSVVDLQKYYYSIQNRKQKKNKKNLIERKIKEENKFTISGDNISN